MRIRIKVTRNRKETEKYVFVTAGLRKKSLNLEIEKNCVICPEIFKILDHISNEPFQF